MILHVAITSIKDILRYGYRTRKEFSRLGDFMLPTKYEAAGMLSLHVHVHVSETEKTFLVKKIQPLNY